jgi:trigger factor
MNITKENIDKLNAVLRVTIEKADYQEKVDEVLKDHRKKAKLNGFRPGKVPFGLIKKMYGKPVLVQEVNKLVSEKISEYLDNEGVKVMGEPLIREEEQEKIDWENQEVFKFVFDLGLSPDIDLEIKDKDKVPYYNIKIDKKMVDEYVDEYARRFGDFKNIEAVEDNEEMLKGAFMELDENNQPKEDGLTVENGTISLNTIQDDKIKKSFKDKKLNDKIVIDVKKAFTNETDLASLLNIKKEELATINNLFEFTINEILKFEKSDINQELFDKIYGEGNVKSEDEFREKLKEDIRTGLNQQSEYKLKLDIKNKLIKKADIELPVDFLKRWILSTNEKITKEQIDEDFEKYEDDLKWQVIRNHIIKENEIKPSDEEIKESAKKFALMQLQQYGIPNLPDEQLENFAMEMLKKEEERKRIVDNIYDEKVFSLIKEKITLTQKELSRDEFNKLLEKEKA